MIKPKSFQKIQQEKLREFGAPDNFGMIAQTADYLLQASASTEVLDNFSRETYSHSGAALLNAHPYGTHTGLPEVRRIPQVRRNASNTHLAGAETKLSHLSGAASATGGL